MKTKSKLVVLGACLLQLASCAYFSSASASQQGIRIEYASTGSPRILHAAAAIARGHTVIRGELGFLEVDRFRFFTGTLRATARKADGTRIDLPKPTIAPRVKPRVAGRRADFTLDAGKMLPGGTVVTLRYFDAS